LKRRFIIVIFLAISTVCFSACNFLPKEEETIQTSVVQPETESSNSYVAKKSDISKSIKCGGMFSSSSSQSLSFKQRSGVISQIYIKNGDTIKKGDVIAELASNESMQDLKKQEFQISKAEATYNDLVNANTSEVEIKRASIDLKIAKLGYESIQLELNKNKIISPISGKVVKMVKTTPGEMVKANESVAIVADSSSINVECEFENAKDAKVGMKAKITYSTSEVEGKVVEVVSSIGKDEIFHTIPYIIINIAGLPKGASLYDKVDVNFETINRKNVIVIPKGFVRTSGDKSVVTILKNNKRTEISVNIGIQNEIMAEVISGINEGDKVTH
jgi:macrolide-specific efflux system membrane fusion protein